MNVMQFKIIFPICANFTTFYNFTGVDAAAAANEEDLFLSCCMQHNCCMGNPLLAEKVIDLIRYDKMI